jgi:hypothetical protein
MKAQEDEIPVSGTDDLTIERREKPEQIRRFGEYKPTNTPLSAVEVQEREALCAKDGGECVWPRRTTQTIHDIIPIEEHEPVV